MLRLIGAAALLSTTLDTIIPNIIKGTMSAQNPPKIMLRIPNTTSPAFLSLNSEISTVAS